MLTGIEIGKFGVVQKSIRECRFRTK